MSANVEHKVQLRIGFLNHDEENLFERYSEAFDIVLLKDTSLEFVTNLISAL
jgi:Pyrimidine 5'-nucleotidase (UMPH-1)